MTNSYEKINMLFKQILKDVKAETYYSENGIRFASNGKSVVFEDIIMSAIYKIEAEEKAAEEGIIEGAGEEGIPQGLWHDMKWKQIITTFDRKPLDSKMPGSNRLGSNFIWYHISARIVAEIYICQYIQTAGNF